MLRWSRRPPPLPGGVTSALLRRGLCSTLPLPLDVPKTPKVPPPALPSGRKERTKLLRRATDLRDPAAFFESARAIRRTIHAHLGPTNSGKTHAALEALRGARSGVYGGPLRLLAVEVHDRLSADGVACGLLTGQERRLVEGASHLACTVEMCSTETPVEVAVLDEIQMLGHPERGWAWTRALLGLRAESVHVCGSADALPLLRSLADACGDELVEHSYERLTPLTATSALGGDLERVRPGDCVVAFSRREIFSLRQRIEASSSLSCSVVYGSLPPETRKAQAARFNDSSQPERVLVASDAIGMGLNLNIRRVVFSSLDKFDGEAVRPLTPSEVRQIAGRAGRYRAGGAAAGEVTCLHDGDMRRLRAGLAAPLPPLERAGLAPSFEQLDAFDRAELRRLPFADVLAGFEESARTDRRYFCCTLEPAVRLAELLELEPALTLAQRHTLSQTPLDAHNDLHADALASWAKAIGRGAPARLLHAPPSRPPRSHSELQQLEAYFQTLDAYKWLAQRFPRAFSQHADRADRYRKQSAELIDAALAELGEAPRDERRGRRR